MQRHSVAEDLEHGDRIQPLQIVRVDVRGIGWVDTDFSTTATLNGELGTHLTGTGQQADNCQIIKLLHNKM